MRTKDLCAFIRERHAMYVRRFKFNKPKPWTQDPILQSYRFCNVYRELDAVTQSIAINWRIPHEEDPQLWFAMTVARLFNNVTTLGYIGYSVPFKPEHIRKTVHHLQSCGDRVFNPAYIVSTNGMAMDKVDYVVDLVLKPMWERRKEITKVLMSTTTLRDVHNELIKCNGIGGFLSGQIIADLKYTPHYQSRADWWEFAASGPGSRRGLNRVCERPAKAPWKEYEWLAKLTDLRLAVNKELAQTSVGMEILHAQDIQNCLCEFDKYERARLGEGKPKQIYAGI